MHESVPETVSLGRAMVLDIYRFAEDDVAAHCYVTCGVVTKTDLARVIREGIVIYPPPNKTARLDFLQVAGANRKLLQEDKNDVAVSEGAWCNVRVSGFMGLRSGDVVETYRIEQAF